MLPHEACYRAFDGNRKTIADELQLSRTLVDKYTAIPRPAGEGEPSPIQRHIEIVRVLRKCGAPNSEFLVEYFLDELGYLPAVRPTDCSDATDPDEIAALLKAVGDLLETHASARADGRLTPNEARAIDEKLSRLQLVVTRERVDMRALITADEERDFRSRKGPHRSMPKFFEGRSRATA